jgi:eukaryotic-like serine/threonine-protein kinase
MPVFRDSSQTRAKASALVLHDGRATAFSLRMFNLVPFRLSIEWRSLPEGVRHLGKRKTATRATIATQSLGLADVLSSAESTAAQLAHDGSSSRVLHIARVDSRENHPTPDMDPDRWRRVASLYELALEREPGERGAFLTTACVDDDELRREVESLLGHDEASVLIDRPMAEMAAAVLDVGPALEPGTEIGPYRIDRLLGAGGMGQVYRATDTTLQRRVALKFLPVHLATDPNRLSRLRREAQLLAALNHPNIAQIYGLEKYESTYCIAMELVDGETLADRVRRGPKPVDEALRIARDIAEALETAHEKGIVHRDLKPANVMVTPEGQVKVLDFGLAKAVEPLSAVADDAPVAPTITSPTMTRMGIILGTAAYMSPEQAKGRAADKRSDVWAFGCVLYELLTGKRAFDAEDVSETLAFVISKEPDWSALPERTPPGIRRLIGRCLQKDRKDRLHDIGDARIEIEDAAVEPEPATPKRGSARVLWIAALGMAIAGGFVGGRYFTRPPIETAETRLEVVTPPYPAAVQTNTLAVSPDGRKLVFVSIVDGQTRLWLRPLDSAAARVLAGTEGASVPFWSPDSQSVAFFADGKLKRMDLAGGLPQTLANVQAATGGTWNNEGVIIFADQGFVDRGARALDRLHRVSASGGGKPVPVPTPDIRAVALRHPQFLPDGRRFLFEATIGGSSTVYVASLDSAEVRPLIRNLGIGVVFVPPDTLLFKRGPERTLFAQRLDTEKLELAGEPVPIAQEVLAVSASAAGVVAYRTEQTARGGGQWTWIDRSGKSAGEMLQLGAAPELSPDGRWLAFQRTGENVDVWLMELARGIATRFTSHDALDGLPIWSPDGSHIVFASNRKTKLDLYRKRADSTDTEEVLFESAENKFPLDWCRCPSGEFILFRSSDNPQTSDDLFAVSTIRDHNKVTVANTPHTESSGRFSPDGRWVAYQSTETGRPEIYLQAFPGPGRKLPISTGGGVRMRWRRDGKELFYLALNGTMMTVPVILSANSQDIDVGRPTALFDIPSTSPSSFDQPAPEYVVSLDGQRFLIRAPRELPPPEPIKVILHWKPPWN